MECLLAAGTMLKTTQRNPTCFCFVFHFHSPHAYFTFPCRQLSILEIRHVVLGLCTIRIKARNLGKTSHSTIQLSAQSMVLVFCFVSLFLFNGLCPHNKLVLQYMIFQISNKMHDFNGLSHLYKLISLEFYYLCPKLII